MLRSSLLRRLLRQTDVARAPKKKIICDSVPSSALKRAKIILSETKAEVINETSNILQPEEHPQLLTATHSSDPSHLNPSAASSMELLAHPLLDAMFSSSECILRTKKVTPLAYQLTAVLPDRTFSLEGTSPNDLLEKFSSYWLNGSTEVMARLSDAPALLDDPAEDGKKAPSIIYQPHCIVRIRGSDGVVHSVRRCDAMKYLDPSVKNTPIEWTSLRPQVGRFKFSAPEQRPGSRLTIVKLMSPAGCCAEAVGSNPNFAVASASTSFLLSTNPTALRHLYSTPDVGRLLEFFCFGNKSVHHDDEGDAAEGTRLAVLELRMPGAHLVEFYSVQQEGFKETLGTSTSMSCGSWTRICGLASKKYIKVLHSDCFDYALQRVKSTAATRMKNGSLAGASDFSISDALTGTSEMITDPDAKNYLLEKIAAATNMNDPVLVSLGKQSASRDLTRPFTFRVPKQPQGAGSDGILFSLSDAAAVWRKDVNNPWLHSDGILVTAEVCYSPFARGFECRLFANKATPTAAKTRTDEAVQLGGPPETGATPFVAYYNALSVLLSGDAGRVTSLQEIWRLHAGSRTSIMPGLSELRDLVLKTVGLGLTVTLTRQGVELMCTIYATSEEGRSEQPTLPLLVGLGRGHDCCSAVAHAVAAAFLQDSDVSQARSVNSNPKMISADLEKCEKDTLVETTSSKPAAIGGITATSSAISTFTIPLQNPKSVLGAFLAAVQTLKNLKSTPQLQLSLPAAGARRVRLMSPSTGDVLAESALPENMTSFMKVLRLALENIFGAADRSTMQARFSTSEFLHKRDYSAQARQITSIEDALTLVGMDYFGVEPVIRTFQPKGYARWVTIVGIPSLDRSNVLQLAVASDPQKKTSRRAAAKIALSRLAPSLAADLGKKQFGITGPCQYQDDKSLLVVTLTEEMASAAERSAGSSASSAVPEPQAPSTLELVLKAAMKRELNCGLRVEVRPLAAGGKSIHAVAVPLRANGLPDFAEEFELDSLRAVDAKKGINLLMYRLLSKNHEEALTTALERDPELIKHIV